MRNQTNLSRRGTKMSNLDDFFKKRDKKKKITTKSKFPTLDTDEFAKKLEATSIVSSGGLEGEETELYQDGGLDVAAPNHPNLPSSNDHLDEDWKPFDSDENKDYTGLRINIQNWKIEDQDAGNDGAIDDNEKKTNCPWAAPSSQHRRDEDNETETNKPDMEKSTSQPQKLDELDPSSSSGAKDQSASKADQQSASATASTTTTQSNTTTAASSAGGAYVPPALRRQQNPNEPSSSHSDNKAQASSESSGKYIPPSMRNRQSNDTSSAIPPTSVNYRRPNKSQPNINDTMEFPTLDSNSTETSTGDKLTNGNSTDKFEMPKKSGKIEQKSGNSMIDLENKFTALSSTNN